MPGRSPVVLGVDPGSRVTGYGVLTQSEGRLIHVASGTIRPSPALPLEQRLKVIRDRLLQVIRETAPEALAVESVFYAKNVKAAVHLAHARGAVLVAAADAGLPVTEFTPAEIKMATVGYGRAEKAQVHDMIVRLLNIRPAPPHSSHDSTDALAVALCQLNSARTKERIVSREVTPP